MNGKWYGEPPMIGRCKYIQWYILIWMIDWWTVDTHDQPVEVCQSSVIIIAFHYSLTLTIWWTEKIVVWHHDTMPEPRSNESDKQNPAQVTISLRVLKIIEKSVSFRYIKHYFKVSSFYSVTARSMLQVQHQKKRVIRYYCDFDKPTTATNKNCDQLESNSAWAH